MDGNLIIQNHTEQHYQTIFNRKTGFFLRIEDEGWPEPFWSSNGPELFDISITNYCERGCSFCYRQANKNGKHIVYEKLLSIVKQAKEIGVLQIALGGGNPNQHPQFTNILQMIREHGIIPSYTTNGDGLTDEVLAATASFCGAMAVSLYPPYDHYENLIRRIKKYSIKVNLHIILKSDTIEILMQWLQNPPLFFSHINALIILNYKRIGTKEDLSIKDKTQLEAFYSIVSKCRFVKIGFDSCSVPGIVTWMNINTSLIESCEAARFSAFIAEDLKMYPCSFMVGSDNYGDLNSESLLDVWQTNQVFELHRERIKQNKCYNCIHQSLCNGGCVFMPEINQCT